MERETEVIELGAASRETRGPFGRVSDEALGIYEMGLVSD